MKEINYNMNPDALKTIESKMRQMQATGQNITPEMMQALYESVLEVGANKATNIAEIEARSAESAANRAQRQSEVDQVLKSRQEEGIGSMVGNTMIRGGNEAIKRGWIKNPFSSTQPAGGTTTPTGIKTVMGGELGTSPGTAAKPSVMAGENLLGDRGTTGLELSPQPAPQTGAVAPITPEPVPSTGGVVSGAPAVPTATPPTVAPTPATGGLPSVAAPVGELAGAAPPALAMGGLPTPPGAEAITELMPATQHLMTPAAEALVPELVAPGLEAGVEAGTQVAAEGLSTAAPSLGLSTMSLPFSVGGLAVDS
jgi:hypothetical protein